MRDTSDFARLVRRRRMIRRYDESRPVPDPTLVRCLDHAIRAPSAGFSQGWDFVVLRTADERAAFWSATAGDDEPDAWLRGLMTAPALILCLSDPGRYLDRYAEPDKGWADKDPARWPVPYWDVDTGMAGLLMLLTAVDEGLGGCFFGVPPDRHSSLRAALGVPDDRRFVGVVSLGYPPPEGPGPTSPSLRRGRRPLPEVTHWGRFGVPRDTPYPDL